MHVDPKDLGRVAGHVAGALEMVRLLLTRHDLGPIARGVVVRAEDALILAKLTISPLVEKANEKDAA